MKGSIGYIIIVLLLSAMAVAAQDYRRYEFYGGYAYSKYDNVISSIDDGLNPNISLHGINAAFNYNVSRYVGIKVDYSLGAQRKTFVDPNLNMEVNYRNNQLLAGIQVQDNSEGGSRWKPFFHILAGVANQRIIANGRVTGPAASTLVDETSSTNNFAMVFGGGLDVRVHKNVDLRLVQFDYNPIFFKERYFNRYFIPRKTQDNIRMSFGVVVH